MFLMIMVFSLSPLRFGAFIMGGYIPTLLRTVKAGVSTMQSLKLKTRIIGHGPTMFLYSRRVKINYVMREDFMHGLIAMVRCIFAVMIIQKAGGIVA